MLVVNESFPGPVIRVHRGDTVFVTVHNQGYYGVTIHWFSLSLSLLIFKYNLILLRIAFCFISSYSQQEIR